MTASSTLTRPSLRPPLGVRRPRHRGRLTAAVGWGSLAPLILSSSVALALSRLILHGYGTRVLVPILVAIVVADVVTALALRMLINVFIAFGLGWAVSLWVLVIAVDPWLFNPFSSHFLHLAALSSQLHLAQSDLRSDGTPLPSLNGVVAIVGAIGALAAALTRTVWVVQRGGRSASDRGALSPCLVPSLAVFVYSTLVSAQQGRVAAFVAYFFGVLAFVALADHAPSPSLSPPSWAAHAPELASPASGGRARRFRWSVGALVGCVAIAGVAIAVGAGLSSMRLTVFHVKPVTTPPGGQLAGQPHQDPITGISLVDHLRTTEISASNVVIFHARSPVPTYWQVGTLSSFNGVEWLPSAGVRGALSGLSGAAAALGPTALPSPPTQHAFTARVSITDFVSRLLPAPPATTAVHGVAGAAVIADEGVLAPGATRAGTAYTVNAGYDTSVPAGGSQLPSSDPRLTAYLALPSQPAIVDQLAHEAVRGATTPGAEAQALVDWFRSGRFRYTLSPPATTGPDPLVQFLTVTKAGFCEQFAGAYGVLARALGIPTRLAVGFTAGAAGPDDTYTLTGADAHVWPEVYLGPAAGWVSVEPTPGTPAAAGVLGASNTQAKSQRAASTTTVPAAATKHAQHRAPRPHHRHSAGAGHGVAWWVLALLALVVVLALVVLVGWTRRWRRSAHAKRLPPDEQVVHAWDHAQGALRRRGLGRRSDETPDEYVARVRSLEHNGPRPVEANAVADLAHLVEMACYTPEPCTPGQAATAQSLASTIVVANRRRPHRRRTVRTVRTVSTPHGIDP